MRYRGFPAHCSEETRYSCRGAWLLRPVPGGPTYAVATEGHVLTFVAVEVSPGDVSLPQSGQAGPWPKEAWPGSARGASVQLLAPDTLSQGEEAFPPLLSPPPQAWGVVPPQLRRGTPPRRHGGVSTGPWNVARLKTAWGPQEDADSTRRVALLVDDFGASIRTCRGGKVGAVLATADHVLPPPRKNDPAVFSCRVLFNLDYLADVAKAIAAPDVLLALPAPLQEVEAEWTDRPFLVLPADVGNPNWALVMPITAL